MLGRRSYQPNRRNNPLDRPGPRCCLFCSPAGLASLRDAAARLGITQRIVLDELLEDLELVKAAAARAAEKLARTDDRGQRVANER